MANKLDERRIDLCMYTPFKSTILKWLSINIFIACGKSWYFRPTQLLCTASLNSSIVTIPSWIKKCKWNIGRSNLAFYWSYFIEVGELCNFFPQRKHNVQIFLITTITEFSFSLDQSHLKSHAFEIVFLQYAIVIRVWIW